MKTLYERISRVISRRFDIYESLGDEDICGLCGEPGADKIPHPNYWPTEQRPDSEYVHSECEREECERAFQEYRNQVGEDGVRRFLKY